MPWAGTVNPTMQTPTPLRARRILLALAAVAILLVPATVAQVQNAQLGAFGTRVKVGDFDYLPLTKRASASIRVAEWDAGIPGDVRDNCILLMMDNTDGGPARAVPGALPAAATVYTKDIRLTPCQGKGIGTPVADTDIVEQTAAYVERAVEVRYGDANGNGKYDRNDPLYIGTLVGGRGLAASTATGAWTVRLTPVGPLEAGTFVTRENADFLAYRTIAAGAAAGSPAARTWSLVEREGNGWYLIPASAGFAAQQAIPVNSLRIGLVGSGNQQPLVAVSSVSLPAEPPQAGESYKVVAKYSNDGTGSGAGLLVTKVDDAIVDARMTPVLGPGEVGQVLIAVPMPAHGGPIVLAIGDSKVRLDVEGPQPAAGQADLAARVAQLEARLASPSPSPATEAKAASVGADGPLPLTVLALLVLGAIGLRRRSA
jgi:MYXO-CTERM domain-containing protein